MTNRADKAAFGSLLPLFLKENGFPRDGVLRDAGEYGLRPSREGDGRAGRGTREWSGPD